MPPTIPTDIAFAVSVLVSVASHLLRDDGLSNKANGIIALIACLLISIATAWLIYGGFTLNFQQDAYQVVAIFAGLGTAVKEFADLLSAVKDAQSPLVASSPVKATTQDWNNWPKPGGGSTGG